MTEKKKDSKVRRLSIKAKILIPTTLIIIVISSVMTLFSLSEMQASLIQMGVEEAEMAAKFSLRIIDGDIVAQLAPGGEATEEYQTQRTKMQEIQQECGIAFLYTLYTDGKDVFYGIDSDSTENVNAIGTPFEVTYEELADVFAGHPYVQDYIDQTEDGDLISAYLPVKDSTGAIVGIVGSDYNASGVLEKIQTTLRHMIAISVICVVVAILIVYIIVSSILKSLRKVQQKMYDLVYNKGDLTQKLDVHTGDEMELISDNINEFLDYMLEIMLRISKNSNQLHSSSQNVATHLLNAENRITEVSATMEEMSASMEECSASLNQISEFITEMEESIESVSLKAISGADNTVEIQTRAAALCHDAKENQLSAHEQLAVVASSVSEKIELSKAVSEITVLTKNILDITAQTNLLALNASIEAARAGEAGRGFAVVADEIAKLASNSAEAAHNIQAVSTKVIDAVEQLAEESEKMIGFMDETAMTGYSKLVETGENYQQDATDIHEMMKQFTQNAKDLSAKIVQMKDYISNVNTAVEENANGVSNIAQTASDLTDKMSDIHAEADDNQTIANNLFEEVDKFTLS